MIPFAPDEAAFINLHRAPLSRPLSDSADRQAALTMGVKVVGFASRAAKGMRKETV